MPTYFVSPRDRPEWGEDPRAFAAALNEHWSSAEVCADVPVEPGADGDAVASAYLAAAKS